MLAAPAALLAAGALLLAGPSSAVGPYPPLGLLPGLPRPAPASSPRTRRRLPTRRPGTRTSRGRRSPATRRRRSPTSTPTAATTSTPTSARRANTASPTPWSAPASASCPIHYTAYGSESDRGPFPIPKGAPVEGGNAQRRRPSRARRRPRRLRPLRALPGLLQTAQRPLERRLGRRSGTCARPRAGPTGWTSADAAGLPIFPGLVRRDEVAGGSLEHAIRVTFESTRDAWVHPASHCAGDTSNPNAPAMGTRLRLKAGYGLGGFSGGARVIATALKRYGMIVADNGSNWFFSGSSDRALGRREPEPAEADPRQRLRGRPQRRPRPTSAERSPEPDDVAEVGGAAPARELGDRLLVGLARPRR